MNVRSSAVVLNTEFLTSKLTAYAMSAYAASWSTACPMSLAFRLSTRTLTVSFCAEPAIETKESKSDNATLEPFTKSQSDAV